MYQNIINSDGFQIQWRKYFVYEIQFARQRKGIQNDGWSAPVQRVSVVSSQKQGFI